MYVLYLISDPNVIDHILHITCKHFPFCTHCISISTHHTTHILLLAHGQHLHFFFVKMNKLYKIQIIVFVLNFLNEFWSILIWNCMIAGLACLYTFWTGDEEARFMKGEINENLFVSVKWSIFFHHVNRFFSSPSIWLQSIFSAARYGSN